MIKAGKFYVDNTPTEKMREERGSGTDSVNRNAPIEQSMEWFEEMTMGKSWNGELSFPFFLSFFFSLSLSLDS